MEPNPDLHYALQKKKRNAWILPHCLSTTQYPQIVDFRVSSGPLGSHIMKDKQGVMTNILTR